MSASDSTARATAMLNVEQIKEKLKKLHSKAATHRATLFTYQRIKDDMVSNGITAGMEKVEAVITANTNVTEMLEEFIKETREELVAANELLSQLSE